MARMVAYSGPLVVCLRLLSFSLANVSNLNILRQIECRPCIRKAVLIVTTTESPPPTRRVCSYEVCFNVRQDFCLSRRSHQCRPRLCADLPTPGDMSYPRVYLPPRPDRFLGRAIVRHPAGSPRAAQRHGSLEQRRPERDLLSLHPAREGGLHRCNKILQGL